MSTNHESEQSDDEYRWDIFGINMMPTKKDRKERQNRGGKKKKISEWEKHTGRSVARDLDVLDAVEKLFREVFKQRESDRKEDEL